MTFTDQLGQTIQLPSPPRRIISLVPSQTELLFHLGLDEEVVGITKFCIHPPEKWRSKSRIGGTKQLDFEKIDALKPDLIIGNKEENDRQQIEQLLQHYPVWMSDISTLEDALDMIKSLGEITGKLESALELTSAIQTAFHSVSAISTPEIPVAYLIWRKPWMAVGSDTFIHHMLAQVGFKNSLGEKTRYPEITLKELAEAAPAVVMLSSEPYPFKQQHVAEIQELCQTTIVKLVDGEMLSWYGSRLLLAAPYLANLRNEIIEALNIKL